jgi:peptidoglycan hydrolase-like protein with peptidoglycan-binding domain
MRVSFWKVISAGLLLMAVPGFALAHPKTNSSKKKSAHASVKPVSATHRGLWHLGRHHATAAVAMPTERATEIQTALIRQGYLTGEPTGTWDAQTVAAMQKLQGDNGWQTKITPDSRALIKLGLGPKDAVADGGIGAGAAPAGVASASGAEQTRDVAQVPRQ